MLFRSRPSKGQRKAIRQIKSEIRGDLYVNSHDTQEAWQKMHNILALEHPGYEALPNQQIIKDWFETRLKFSRLTEKDRRETVSAFSKKYQREELFELREILQIITRTVR